VAVATSYPESGDAPWSDDQPTLDATATGSTLAHDVRKKWEAGGKAIARARKNYWLNLSFCLGDQWVYWDKVRNEVAGYPEQWSPLGPERECVIINRMGPNLEVVMGRMLKAMLSFEVPPTDSSDGAVRGARTSAKVLEGYHREQDWELLRQQALADAFYGGASAVMVEWDGTRGTELQYDQATDQVVSTGDAYLRALNIHEFCLEPTARHGQESRWGIVGVAMPVDAAKEQYRLKWMPRSDVLASRSPIHLSMMDSIGRSSDKDQCLVLSYYERPHTGCRAGRYCIVINDQIVYQGKWPFPFKHLNIHVARQRQIAGKWYGHTMLNDAAKVQVMYNFARSVIAEHLKKVANMRITAPRGQFFEEDLTDRVGEILWYTPDGTNARPDYMAPPNLARFISAEPEALKAELDEIMHIHDISRGEAFDRASGQAIALLSEKDESPLGMMAHEQASLWGRTGSQVLKLLETKGTESRKVSIPLMRGLSQSVTWDGKMLRGQTNATVSLDSVMAKSAAAREAFWKDLWDRKIVTDARQYARGVGVAPENFDAVLDPEEALVQSENYRMIQGIVEFPEEFHDDAKHIEGHNRFRLSDEYRFADEDRRSIVDDHIRMHENQMHEQMANQVNRAQMNPALAAMPQAINPPGAFRMPTLQDRQMEAALAEGQSGTPPSGPDLGAGGTTPALAAGLPAPA
jgi:hypothetical protein